MSVRIYSSPRGRPRFRRSADVVLVVAAVIGLGLLIAAYPPSDFERSFSAFLASFPGWLDPVWAFLDDVLWLWAIVLVVAALIARRPAVALEGIGSVLVAAAVAFVATRLATGDWPDLGAAITGSSCGALLNHALRRSRGPRIGPRVRRSCRADSQEAARTRSIRSEAALWPGAQDQRAGATNSGWSSSRNQLPSG
jgi:hypothetical protein